MSLRRFLKDPLAQQCSLCSLSTTYVNNYLFPLKIVTSEYIYFFNYILNCG